MSRCGKSGGLGTGLSGYFTQKVYRGLFFFCISYSDFWNTKQLVAYTYIINFFPSKVDFISKENTKCLPPPDALQIWSLATSVGLQSVLD